MRLRARGDVIEIERQPDKFLNTMSPVLMTRALVVRWTPELPSMVPVELLLPMMLIKPSTAVMPSENICGVLLATA